MTPLPSHLSTEEARQLSILHDVYVHPNHTGIWDTGLCERLVEQGLAEKVVLDGYYMFVISPAGIERAEALPDLHPRQRIGLRATLRALLGMDDRRPACCPTCGQVVEKKRSWIEARFDPLTRYLEGEIDAAQFEREVRV